MSITLAIALVVCILGAVVYLVVANGKAQEMGRLAYAVGLLVTLLSIAGSAVHMSVGRG